ncbi:MAG: MOP flippase family protein [Candidatus Marinimicrobia bacterium]|nr:MOP flippase family protein [Candidatus Neomarinimicrobiota bacterium]MBL7109671.1 MOP flippase family protein [Candidatus Neomarinimicrobiota bacterium]
MLDNLKNKTIRAFFWSLSGQLGQQSIVFVISVILARLLEPYQFGLIGILSIFVALANTLLDFGFGSAIVQRQNLEQKDLSTIFYFNVGTGICLSLILFFTAPLIASFFEIPQLSILARVLSANFIINSLAIVHGAILVKKIDFKTQVLIRLFSIVISGTIAITLAINGWGVWSLVIQTISQNILNTILLWVISDWKPSAIFRFKSLKEIFGFSANIAGSSIINVIFDKLDIILVGKLYAPTDLGFYTRAMSLQMLPIKNTYRVLRRVMFPVLSKIQNDLERLRSVYVKVIHVVAFISFPLMFGLLVVANPLVRVLLTDKWLPVVKYLQLLCLGGFLYPLSAINLNILLVKGRADIFFRLEIVKKVILTIAIIIGLKWGIVGLISAKVITSYIAFYLNIKYSGNMINYSITQQLKDLFPYFVLSIIMAMLTYAVGLSFDNQTVKLVIEIFTGVIIYYLLCKLFKIQALRDTIHIIKDFNLKY